MTESIRWGILATGGIAHAFTSDLVQNGHKVQAVGSRSQASADAFAAEFGIPTAHASYAELVDDPEVDVIYVSTPHPFHAEHAALALNAGKHVLIEKPIAINAGEARQIVNLAASKNLLVMEALWTRFLPHLVRIREILAAGTLGEVRSLIADHTQDLPDDPAHRLNSLELGGGALLDLGVYPVNFAHAVFGSPDTILASASFKATGADAQVATIFRYPGGQIATTFSSSDTLGPTTASIIGTHGRIDIDGVWYAPTSFRVLDNGGTVLEAFARAEFTGRGMQFEAVEVEELIRAGKISSDIMPAEESVAVMTTLDAVRAQIGLRYPGE
ncbi:MULTISPECIES: Gfo/Idh/MocA family protein [Cryobacterium]|uniref:Gfo/Idh/MocA family oxidoreductase n=1 Tax=Cryobacterium levicorallinum TaxID=995038 RepID=A0A1I2ZTF6_9MICO|nr:MULTISPECIES: Gfo/Idh/MocA family oxidoreductase [Cryobacterium]TFB89664.1 Gfo/Idh/MocA family oxidoreductase [Cryobacterium levicorallinum]TFD56499.1 Gfo/Idh/MocA family oxidoreductase [Cryobacterium sp. Hh38]GEP26026.1 oxidoreductase [Cryobacterium levicorallinum]SFH40361.1 Predicted dehydrogenase [Cryobacterium levicorallinum]